jgi:type II secretory pathway pseudopilin PulG
MFRPVVRSGRRVGFTQFELALVLALAGVMAVLEVPRFLESVERAKASEAFAYLSAVRSAQERYLRRHGEYTSDLEKLDFRDPIPPFFTAGPLQLGSPGELRNSWSLTLTRRSRTGYGPYTILFTDAGFDADRSGIQRLPDINPLGLTVIAKR